MVKSCPPQTCVEGDTDVALQFHFHDSRLMYTVSAIKALVINQNPYALHICHEPSVSSANVNLQNCITISIRDQSILIGLEDVLLIHVN